MANDEFKVGDVVKLKSGGLKMTIESIDGNVVNCQWFDKDNALKYGYFNMDTLVKVAVEGGKVFLR